MLRFRAVHDRRAAISLDRICIPAVRVLGRDRVGAQQAAVLRGRRAQGPPHRPGRLRPRRAVLWRPARAGLR